MALGDDSVSGEGDLAEDNWVLDVSSRCSRICLVHLFSPERRERESGVPGTKRLFSTWGRLFKS
jgi:hypothetical protein